MGSVPVTLDEAKRGPVLRLVAVGFGLRGRAYPQAGAFLTPWLQLSKACGNLLPMALADMDYDIVTGGGPGLMQAANEGARSVDATERLKSMGIRVELPFEQEVNPFVDQAFLRQSFFSRLHHFVLISNDFIVAPGGMGTVLESMMIWPLLQVRHRHVTPLIFAGPMWAEMLDWARRSVLRPGFKLASPEDMEIPLCVNTADEAIALVRDYQAQWKRKNVPGS